MQATRFALIAAWILAAALIAVNVAGYVFDLYRSLWWFDRVLHASTILALTYCLAVLVFARALDARYWLVSILLFAAAGIACGALWEVAEWSFDRLKSGDVIKGKNDTILDVVMDTAGALAAAIAVRAGLVGR